MVYTERKNLSQKVEFYNMNKKFSGTGTEILSRFI
jgi:hypothetical protein